MNTLPGMILTRLSVIVTFRYIPDAILIDGVIHKPICYSMELNIPALLPETLNIFDKGSPLGSTILKLNGICVVESEAN